MKPDLQIYFPRGAVSSILGSMSPNTSCVAEFNWFFPGTGSFVDQISPMSKDISGTILEGRDRTLKSMGKRDIEKRF